MADYLGVFDPQQVIGFQEHPLIHEVSEAEGSEYGDGNGSAHEPRFSDALEVGVRSRMYRRAGDGRCDDEVVLRGHCVPETPLDINHDGGCPADDESFLGNDDDHK